MGQDRISAGRSALTRVGDVVFGADQEIGQWVTKRIPGFRASPDCRSLGVIREGRVVAGIVFENFNGIHIEAAIAAETGSRWATRPTLFSIFHYPFGTLGCEAISVSVPSTNLESLNLATKLGFEPEALIRFAAHDGSTLVILKAFRDRCKWIMPHGKEELERAGGA